MNRSVSPPRPPRAHRDHGSAAVEFAVAVPVLVLILITMLQLGAWAIAGLAARQAANQALQTSRVLGGTEAAGRADGTAMLIHLGGSLLRDPTITVTRTTTTTTVTVTGHANGVPAPVTVTVQAPTERYTS